MATGEQHGTETFGKCSLEKQPDGPPAWVCDAATQHVEAAKSGGNTVHETKAGLTKEPAAKHSSASGEAGSAAALPVLTITQDLEPPAPRHMEPIHPNVPEQEHWGRAILAGAAIGTGTMILLNHKFLAVDPEDLELDVPFGMVGAAAGAAFGAVSYLAYLSRNDQ